MNWGFNVFPLLKLTKIWVNNAVQEDLKWATHHMHASLGINVLSCVTWEVENADTIVFCDTCMEGLTFYYPGCSAGFYAPVPKDTA
jgi:hypothetical protein